MTSLLDGNDFLLDYFFHLPHVRISCHLYNVTVASAEHLSLLEALYSRLEMTRLISGLTLA